MWIDRQILEDAQNQLTLKVFYPKETFVILGNGNSESEADLNACRRDNIPVLRRSGGGGAVVLYPGTLIVSLGAWVQNQFKNGHYFDLLNVSLANSIEESLGIQLTPKGISDLAYNDKKVVGTSLFRSRHYLLFQASILVENGIDLMERYLAYPSKEPDYRRNRSHREFVVGLQDIKSFARDQFVLDLQRKLPLEFFRLFENERYFPEEDEIQHVKRRLDRLKK